MMIEKHYFKECFLQGSIDFILRNTKFLYEVNPFNHPPKEDINLLSTFDKLNVSQKSY